jgi:hypothetical protein
MNNENNFEFADVLELLGDLKGHKEHLEKDSISGDFFLLTMRECAYLVSLLEKVVAEGK